MLALYAAHFSATIFWSAASGSDGVVPPHAARRAAARTTTPDRIGFRIDVSPGCWRPPVRGNMGTPGGQGKARDRGSPPRGTRRNARRRPLAASVRLADVGRGALRLPLLLHFLRELGDLRVLDASLAGLLLVGGLAGHVRGAGSPARG